MTFLSQKTIIFDKNWNFHQKSQPNVTKKSRAVNIAQWNIDFQYQYQYIEDIDAGIDIEFRFLRILILILILRLEKILVLILILILIVFQGQYWYWSWYWKWNFRKYWYWYWAKIWYCPMSDAYVLALEITSKKCTLLLCFCSYFSIWLGSSVNTQRHKDILSKLHPLHFRGKKILPNMRI